MFLFVITYVTCLGERVNGSTCRSDFDEGEEKVDVVVRECNVRDRHGKDQEGGGGRSAVP